MTTLNLAGIITRVCEDLKLRFAAIIHNHSASDITSGTLPIDRGGTGAASVANARTNLGISGTWYGTSSTTASTAAKVVTCANFTLAEGAIVSITFTYENTCVNSALTLNINSTGAKTIYVDGIATSTNNTLLWGAQDTLTFVYSGSYWYLVSRSTNIIEKNNLVVLKHPDIDINNAPEENIYGGDGALVLADSSRNQIGFLQTMHYADDIIWTQLGCNNRTSDDWNTISLGFDSNDEPVINIGYPGVFRNALDLGKKATPVSGTSAISIAKSTNTNITSISPGSGKWIVFARCRWAATTAGNRTIKLSTVSGDTSTPINVTAIPYGSAAYMGISGCFELSSNNSVYLIAYHDNGSAVNVSNYEITAYRIG